MNDSVRSNFHEKGVNEADLVVNAVKTWLGNPVSRVLLKFVSKRTKKGSRLEIALKKYAGETEKVFKKKSPTQ